MLTSLISSSWTHGKPTFPGLAWSEGPMSQVWPRKLECKWYKSTFVLTLKNVSIKALAFRFLLLEDIRGHIFSTQGLWILEFLPKGTVQTALAVERARKDLLLYQVTELLELSSIVASVNYPTQHIYWRAHRWMENREELMIWRKVVLKTLKAEGEGLRK